MSEPSDRRLWLVRHAQPHIAPGVCYGRLDVAADPLATQQASAALAAALPPAAQVLTSPAQRCTALAAALAELRPALAAQTDYALQELHFGTWEGQSWDTIGPVALDAWTADFAHHAPGGGETLAAMLQRVQAALARAGHAPCREVVWITHAGVARCVHHLLRHPLPSDLHTLRIAAADWAWPAPAWGGWTVLALPPDAAA
ncbi:histidine phosphatase family protein [Acidovorax lacteus]|uniref:Alpha-ribazole phosphatase n=1 Tax=Acidovorax lacteus TaxID=1924988 RepID=A0ABP8L0U3_9BURK